MKVNFVYHHWKCIAIVLSLYIPVYIVLSINRQKFMLQFQHKQIFLRFCKCIQGGRGHCAVYFTSPQSFIIIFSYSVFQQLWELLLNFECVKTFQLLIVIYRRNNFVNKSSIYRPLSYPWIR